MSPEIPPEAEVIRLAREAMDMTAQSAAEASRARDGKGISAAYWRDVERGYGGRRGQRVPTRASARALAAMARVVGVTPVQLADAGREDAARVLGEILRRESPVPQRPAPTARHGLSFGGKTEAERAALRPYVQQLLRAVYARIGMLDRFPAGDLPYPDDFETGEAAVTAIPGEEMFPNSETDAGTWDNPRFDVRQKLDIIAKGHRFSAEMDERQQGRRTGLTVPALLSVAGGASRASSR